MVKMIHIAKPIIGQEELDNVREVLESGMLAQGKWVKRFEGEFSKFSEVKYAAACSNGTAALDLAMRAIGIGPGDEVIVPDFTFIATANSVVFQNAKPVFAEVNEDNFNIDPEDVAKKITDKTKAVIAVHLFGQAADMKELQEVCAERHIKIIEDACQAHGAKYHDKVVGGIGDVGCFSFYPTKNITCGEGGMVTTNNPEIDEKIRVLRDQGQSEKYVHTRIGFNFRMTDIAAAIGSAQLGKISEFTKKRQDNAKELTEGLSKIEGVTTPKIDDGKEHVFHQYVIKVEKDRDQAMKILREKEVGTAVHYPTPIHKQPSYKELGYPDDICPTCTRLSEQVLSLPVHPSVSNEDISKIIQAVKEVVA
jgi:perosamine synthetase